jgi:uncharacterized protein (UPF0332 family)
VSLPSDRADAWGLRASQNLQAASLLAARHPALLLPAVSRIYYACFQAACAALAARRTRFGESHGELWRAAERMSPGVGRRIWWLYKWRLRADYATGEIPDEQARSLVAEYATLAADLGVSQEFP